MPEVVMMHACNQWLGAREIAKKMGNGWSVVEGHFLQMGGFSLHHDGRYKYPYLGIGALSESPDLCPAACIGPSDVTQTKIRRAGYDKLRTLHDFMTKQEIQDRSKSDGLAKLVVLVQTAWFTGQCLARAVQKLAITELEIVTLAYTALNGVMYFFWWNKPLDVQFPLVIEVDLPQEKGAIAETPLPFPPPPHETSGDNKTQSVAETHYSSPDWDEGPLMTQQVWNIKESGARFPRV